MMVLYSSAAREIVTTVVLPEINGVRLWESEERGLRGIVYSPSPWPRLTEGESSYNGNTLRMLIFEVF